MKYIVIEYQIYPDMMTKEEIILFPETLVHNDFGQYCIHQYMSLDFKNVNIVSAGFCNAEAKCYGESETLKLKSREEDSGLIFRMQYHMNTK